MQDFFEEQWDAYKYPIMTVAFTLPILGLLRSDFSRVIPKTNPFPANIVFIIDPDNAHSYIHTQIWPALSILFV